jgi:hypothetical protein
LRPAAHGAAGLEPEKASGAQVRIKAAAKYTLVAAACTPRDAGKNLNLVLRWRAPS